MSGAKSVFIEHPSHRKLIAHVENMCKKIKIHSTRPDETKPFQNRVDLIAYRPYFGSQGLWNKLFPETCDIAKVECLTWYSGWRREERIMKLKEKIREHSGFGVDYILAVPNSRFQRFYYLTQEAVGGLATKQITRGLIEVWGIDIASGRLVNRKIITPSSKDLSTLRLQVELALMNSNFNIDGFLDDAPNDIKAEFNGEVQFVEGRCILHDKLFEMWGPYGTSTLWRRFNECFICKAEGMHRKAKRNWHITTDTKTLKMRVIACCLTTVNEDEIIKKYEKYQDYFDMILFFFLRIEEDDLKTIDNIAEKLRMDPHRVQFYLKTPESIWCNELSPIAKLKDDVREAIFQYGVKPSIQKQFKDFM